MAEDDIQQPEPPAAAAPTAEPAATTPETPASPARPQAEPGLYHCGYDNAGEHPVLGRLETGQDYDYSQVRDPRVLEAIAACVQAGLLVKK